MKAFIFTFTVLTTVLAQKDGLEVADALRGSKKDAIAADFLLGALTPQWTGYAALNSEVPAPLQVNCHNPVPAHNSTSSSPAAKEYVRGVQYVIGDGYQPALVEQPKGTYNQSWGFGLYFSGK